MMGRTKNALLLVSVAALLAGCGSGETADGADGSDGAPGAEGPEEVPQSGLTKGLVLPVEAYLVSEPEQVAWQRAQRNLWKSCMSKFGFDFDPPEPRIAGVPGYNGANMQRRYGVADEAVAAEFGYHLPGGDYEPATWEPGDGAEEAVFTGSGAALRGREYEGSKVPKGGCRGAAERELKPLVNTRAETINHESLQRSQQDPAVSAAIADWSACMKKSGYEVASPYKAAEITRSISLDSPPKKEITVAVRDVECKTSTDLVQTWYAVEKKYQQEAVEKQQLVLDEERKANEEILKTAARINE